MARFRQFKPHEWIEEINAGLEYRRRFGIESTWAEMEAMYYNVHPSMANDGPNVLLSTGDSMMSSLTVPDPAVIVKPEQQEAVSSAPILETIDNILLRELEVGEEVDTATLHAYIFGTGFIKIGFDSEYGFDPELDVGGTLKFGFTLTQLDERGSRRIEHDSSVTPGMPWVKAVPPHDIIVPWGTLKLTNCPWIVHRFVRHIDDLKADPKYSNTRDLSPTLSMEDFVGSYKSSVRLWKPPTGDPTHSKSRTRRGSRDTSFVELYEVHDRRTGRIMVVTDTKEKFLRNDINALQIDNLLPFASISFTPKTRSIWTTSDTYYLRQSQVELSDLAVQRTKIRRLAVLKFLYDKTVISEEEFAKLLSTDVGAAAAIEGGGDISKAVLKLENRLDQTLIMEEEHLRRNTREQVGFSRNQLGEFSSGRSTATEARNVAGASALRISRRGKAMGTLYRDIIKIVNGIIFEHWTTPRYVEVIGEDAARTWQQVTGRQLRARYSYKVTFTNEDELRERRFEALQMYLQLSQDPSVDPVALRLFITDQYNDPSFARLFNADIQNAMRIMRLAGGIPGSQGTGSQPAPAAGVPQLQQTNGQATGVPQLPRLALGGTNA